MAYAQLNERGRIDCHRSEEGVFRAIGLLKHDQRRRLGWLLRKHGGLPGYFVLRDKGYKVALDAHLTPMQIRLYESLLPLGSRHHESKLIAWLWNEPSTTRSQSRIRKLASRVNDNLLLSDSDERIGRVEPGVLMLNTQEELENLKDARLWPTD
jgi:hypothetical protein